MPAGELNTRQRAVLLTLMVAGREVTNPELHAAHGLRLDGADRRRLNRAGLVTSRRVGRSFAHELTDAGWRACRDELRAAPPRAPGSLGAALYAVLGGLAAYLDRTNLRLADVFGDLGPTLGDPGDAGTGEVLPAGGATGDAGREPGAGGAATGGPTGPHRADTHGTDAPAAPATPATGTDAGRPAGGPATGPPAGVEDRIRAAYAGLVSRPRGWVPLADVRRALDGTTGRAEQDAALRALYRARAVNLVPESNQKALTAEDRAAAVHIGGEDKHLLSIDLQAWRG